MENNIWVSNSYFHDLNKQGCGAVFEVSSIHIYISCCSFAKVSSSSYGACIYALKSQLVLKQTSFDTCFITVSQDSLYGNIICLDNQNNDESILSTIDYESHCRCGEANQSGDSSIYFGYTYYHLSNINSSFNGDTKGASLFSSRYSIENSYIKFSQDSNSTSYIAIESQKLEYECINCNFINTINLQHSIIWSNPHDKITFCSCIFYNSHQKLYNKPCNFENCQFDISFPNISKTLQIPPQFNEIKGFIDKCNQEDVTYHNIVFNTLSIKVLTYIYLFLC